MHTTYRPTHAQQLPHSLTPMSYLLLVFSTTYAKIHVEKKRKHMCLPLTLPHYPALQNMDGCNTECINSLTRVTAMPKLP